MPRAPPPGSMPGGGDGASSPHAHPILTDNTQTASRAPAQDAPGDLGVLGGLLSSSGEMRSIPSAGKAPPFVF